MIFILHAPRTAVSAAMVAVLPLPATVATAGSALLTSGRSFAVKGVLGQSES